VKWSPAGNKFAVASGAKCVPVCHFEKGNNWWISKMIKKHKSTVLSLAWCPNNQLLVTGCADYKCRIMSAFIDGLDTPDATFLEAFPKQSEFGETLMEFDHAKAWVNAVAWSPAGFRVAFTGHGSTVHCVQILAGGAPLVQTIEDTGLPYLDLAFVDNNTLILGGYSRNPTVYKAGGMETEPDWKQVAKLDPEKQVDAKKGASTAMSKFKEADTRGEKFGGATEIDVSTAHKNTITNLQVLSATEVSTAGLDGRILRWKL